MRVGSSPDKAGAGQYCQMVWARRTRREGVTRVNQWLNLRNRGSGSNLADVGRAAVRAERTNGEATSGTVIDAGPGGREESLRRTRGDAAGAELGTAPADRDDAFLDAVEVVAMDGFTGFKTAAAEEIPDAVTVMDPFHVVRLAGDALDRCRRRVQLAIHGHRGFRDDPLYKSRRTLHTGADLLTDKQNDRLRALFVDDAHVEVEAAWGVYQRMIAAYRHEDRQRGRELMEKLITDLSAGVPKVLTELTTLGRTLKKRAADVLAYFERPGTSNGPTEALNGRLEHLRGSALGFRNLTNYIARSLLETGGFRPQLLHPRLG